MSVLGAVVALCAPVLRMVLLLEKDLPWTWQDGRGFVSDLAVGTLFAALAVALSSRTRLGAWVLGAVWVVLNFMQYEHVRVFDAEVQVTYAAYLTDATFLQGSALEVTHPVLFGGVLALLVGTAWFWKRQPVPSRLVWRTAAAGAVLSAVTAMGPLHAHHLPWRQLHVLGLTARAAMVPTTQEVTAPTVEGLERAAQVYRVDLSGTPRMPLPAADGGGRRRNVLIVALEGLSGGFLQSVARHQGVSSDVSMPLLEATGHEGLVFENFLGHQRQTNRGLYSLLCSDLPKQTSDEARMSEWVRTGEATHRACLPQILEDAGWRTAYLQAAPLAFMMKDQFMASIGFEEVHGNASFPKAYARSKWGMDDKAFFEQAAQKLIALGQREEPFFATLLTVGTHHPYIIPDGFGRGSSQQRILTYADEALDTLLQTLREAGVLEDTLVFITSDESGGLGRGDDLTRALSQNWLPLVVLGPDVPAARVVAPYSHPDLAVSVLDYLGMPERGGHLMGRSLFRDYQAPRPFYFANTYFKRAHALDEDGVLSICTETLHDCKSYAVDPQRPFGPARRPVAWQPSRLSGWRGVWERSVAPIGEFAPTELQLVNLGEVEISGDEEEILFGGQYFNAVPGARYEVELDFEVARADALVLVEQDLFAEGRVLHRPPLSLLGEGDRVRLRYDFVFKEGMKALEARMKARPIHGTEVLLRIHEAKLTVTPNVGDGTWERLTVHHFRIDRQPRDERLVFSLADVTPFRKPRCVWEDKRKQQLVGRSCRATYPVFGPYAYARKGAKVKGRFEVEITGGEAKLRADLVSEMSRNRHVQSEQRVLKRGESTVFELEFDAREPLEGIESRLEFRPVSESASFVVKDVSLTIEPPAKTRIAPVSAVR